MSELLLKQFMDAQALLLVLGKTKLVKSLGLTYMGPETGFFQCAGPDGARSY